MNRRWLAGIVLVLSCVLVAYYAITTLTAGPEVGSEAPPTQDEAAGPGHVSRRPVGIAYPSGEQPFILSATENLVPADHDLLEGAAGPISLLFADRWMVSSGGDRWTFFLHQREQLTESSAADVEAARAALGEGYQIAWLIAEDCEAAPGDAITFRPGPLPPDPVAALQELLHPPLRLSRRTRAHLSGTLPVAGGLNTGAGAPGVTGHLLLDESPAIIVLTYPEETFHVGLYTGRGSFDQGAQAIGNFLDHYDISWSEIDETTPATLEPGDDVDLLWFPGGFSAEYRYYVQGHDRIRDFVAGGGAYIGICAGAYYAADIMQWRGGDGTDYPLNLFDGRAIGPIGSPARWGEPTALILTPGHPANTGHGPVLDVYYLDGPYFSEGGDGPVQVLARYEANDRAAAITFSYGEGRVLLLGPHPELGFDAGAGLFDVEGGSGAQWPWLHSVFRSLFLGRPR